MSQSRGGVAIRINNKAMYKHSADLPAKNANGRRIDLQPLAFPVISSGDTVYRRERPNQLFRRPLVAAALPADEPLLPAGLRC
jgi:hypothetical protein